LTLAKFLILSKFKPLRISDQWTQSPNSLGALVGLIFSSKFYLLLG